jgi:uncharacterized membrane protein YdjX (TVP38/TMEM64 family)
MTETDGRGSRIIILAVAAGVVILLVVAGIGVAGGYFHDFEASVWIAEIEETIISWGPWGAAVSIGIMALHSFVPFPAEFLAIANGMLYGPVLGTAITWTGGTSPGWIRFLVKKRLIGFSWRVLCR